MLSAIASHPTWVCGLKQERTKFWNKKQLSHPTWVCGLKHHIKGKENEDYTVTPYVGVWIETVRWIRDKTARRSHPTWVCGLKQPKAGRRMPGNQSHPTWVCGLKLVWFPHIPTITMSHPTWVCGLKQRTINTNLFRICHTLRGCVD